MRCGGRQVSGSRPESAASPIKPSRRSSAAGPCGLGASAPKRSASAPRRRSRRSCARISRMNWPAGLPHERAMPAKVVLTDYVWESLDVEKNTLDGIAALVALHAKSAAEFLPQAADCDALLNTYAGPITADVMAQMPKCKIIARYGIGVDTIDLSAATAAGIIVTNNPTYCVEEVAEHTMALILACARKIAFYDRGVRGGRWDVPSGKPMSRLVGATLGLVGFGNIARQVAIRAHAFGMQIVFADPFVEPGSHSAPGTKLDLEAVLSTADFLSLHPPLGPQTRQMINDGAFERMKKTAFLINCARGPIIDTAALVRALDAGRIAGC